MAVGCWSGAVGAAGVEGLETLPQQQTTRSGGRPQPGGGAGGAEIGLRLLHELARAKNLHLATLSIIYLLTSHHRQSRNDRHPIAGLRHDLLVA